MVFKLIFIFAGFQALSLACDFNETVEQMILSQKRRWCSGVFHSVQLRHQDDEFFTHMCTRNYSSYNLQELRRMRYKRQAPRMRTEYRCLSSSERTLYHSALQRMKNTVVGGLSEYDNFVVRHDGRVAPSAHFGPSFGPWHREYLMTLERAIHVYCPTCMIPYWDSRLDKRLGGNPADSIMFSPLTFGNAVGQVTTGFAANWRSASPECAAISPTLRRNMNPTASSLYDDRDVAFADAVGNHQSMSYPWVTNFEFSHGYVHTAFGPGSHMRDIICSPSDPIFVSHHAFIDYLFERSRVNMKRSNGLRYPSTTTANLPPGFDDSDNHLKTDCAGSSPMRPFPNLINSFGLLSDIYTSQLYTYARTPGDVTCNSDSNCCSNGNTEFLWCDGGSRRCRSKVQEGGRINAAFPARACHCGGGRTPWISASTCRCRAAGILAQTDQAADEVSAAVANARIVINPEIRETTTASVNMQTSTASDDLQTGDQFPTDGEEPTTQQMSVKSGEDEIIKDDVMIEEE